jgi:DNA-binding SARP family transcriptional activator/tetratricopeptide (TPR) repeat protein
VTLRVCAGAVGETLPKPWRPLLPLVWLRFTVGAMATRIRLCGRLEVELEGQRVERRLPGRQGPLVLAMLVLNRGRPVARDELIGALWPGEPPADPDEALSALLSKIRQAVGRETLTGRRELTLSLPADAEVDFEQALAASERAEAGTAGGDHTAASEAGSAVLEIAGRGFLVGLDAPWVEDRRRELEELRLRALEAVAEAGVALGGAHLAGAERAARELVRAAPLREAGHRLLMEALAARGEVAEALAAYEELRVLLREELGMAPGAAIRALHERLLTGEPARARPAPAGATPQRVPLPALLARERGEFVGRERELESLRRAWQDARAGHRRLVLLGGGPGIGKTRLAGELAREAHAGGTVLYGGCQEEALVSYQPFVEALRHYVRGESLDGALTRFGAGGVELARLIPELAQQLPHAPEAVPDDPETRRYLMFEAVSALLSEACGQAPVLLILDDLHWADRSTLQLLRHLVRAQDEAALLILGSYRDLEIAPEHPLPELLADLRRDRLFERLSLEGLDRRSVEALITSHAGQAAPSALVQTVHADTEGNPFFVEEMVRHLIETGVMFGPGGRWSSAPTPDQLGVPEGVKEVLARRLARLSQTSRSVLSQAAVLGREFPYDLLATMAEIDEESLIGALEEALGARLVVEEEGSVSAFTHALVRETLYGALSAPRRQRMHARAALAIEAVDDSDHDARIAALALHYRLAGPAVDPAKGIAYSLRAGERARQLFAWDETAAHWAGALALMERAGTEPAERARLLEALAVVCAVLGDLARQIGYLERALGLYAELGDGERAAQVHSRLGMAHSLIDSIYAEHLDIRRAFRHFDAARSVLERGPVRTARGHLETGVATALTYGLQIEPGIEAASRAIAIAEQLGDEALWAGAVEAYGWHKIVAGELTEGFAAQVRAFEAADRGQRPFLAWMAFHIRGQMTWGLGDPDRAQGFFERLLGLSYAGETAYGQQLADGIGRCHMSRGELAPTRALLSDAKPTWITHSLQPLVDLWEGNWDRVEALARRVLETSRRTGNRWDEWASHHLAARLLSLRGQPERAAESLERARRIVDEGGARYFELWVLPDLARAKAETGRLDEARAHVDRCREIIAGGEDWRGRRAIADVAEAVVLSFEERPDEADARFASALDTLRNFKLVADEADALQQWALALARAGERSRAAEKLEAAADFYRRHGAGAAWLKRLEGDTRLHGVST